MLLYIIRLIHILFVAFMILVPFFGNKYLLRFHFILVPFLFIHWILNDNTCALTLLESKLTGVNTSDTFIGRIVEPVYDISSRNIYVITLALYFVTCYRVYTNGFF